MVVLQFAEHLSDRAAADAVRRRIDWKDLLGLELTAPGFAAAVLSEFRTRLIAGNLPLHLFDALLTRCPAVGLRKARGRQRTASPHGLAAIRARTRREGVGETVRHALQALATAAPDWLPPHRMPVWSEWAERYGARFDAFGLPKGKAEREPLAETSGRDGYRLLEAIDAPDAPSGLRTVPAVEPLRRVWVPAYDAPTADGHVRWRAGEDLPPAAQMVNAPHAPDARCSSKRDTKWTGDKAHLTETCDPAAPQLITHVETTPATPPTGPCCPPATPRWPPRGCCRGSPWSMPATWTRTWWCVVVQRQTEHDVAVVGPVPPDLSWQARAGAGFAVACFTLDWEQRRATCPQGKPSVPWSATHDTTGNDISTIRFARADGLACAHRAAGTRRTTGPRELTVRPRPQHEALPAARQYQTTAACKAQYDARAGVEGTLSEGLRVCDLRRARYDGTSAWPRRAANTCSRPRGSTCAASAPGGTNAPSPPPAPPPFSRSLPPRHQELTKSPAVCHGPAGHHRA